MPYFCRILLLAGVSLLFTGTGAYCDGFGSVEGQFLLEGDIPEQKVIPAAGAAAVCGNIRPLELVVDEKTKGIANIFVYLRRAPSSIAPRWQNKPLQEVEFDQKNCEFLPRAMFVRAGQTVRVKSADPFAHNVHLHPIVNQPKNFLVTANDRVGIPLTLPRAEPLPMKINCDLHPHMTSYWLVLDHPYAAVTDAKGQFTIEDLPAGKHRLTVWHERVGYVDRAMMQTFDVEVTPGETTQLQPVGVPVEILAGR